MEHEISEIKVSQAMTKDVVAASTSNKISQLIVFFVERNINHIPVVDYGKLVGIISIKDVMRVLAQKSLIEKNALDFTKLDEEIKLADFMTHRPITVSPDTTIEAAKKVLAHSNFQALPVVENGILVGILTCKDLVKLRIIKIDGSDYNPI